MSLRQDLMGPVVNNRNSIVGLGAGLQSILPRAGVNPPGVPLWLLFKLSNEVVVDPDNPIYRVGGFSWWIYDTPGEQYYRIDDVIAQLLKWYPTSREVYYTDDAGQAWHQQLTTVSEDLVDDDWHHHFKIVEWILWRDNP